MMAWRMIYETSRQTAGTRLDQTRQAQAGSLMGLFASSRHHHGEHGALQVFFFSSFLHFSSFLVVNYACHHSSHGVVCVVGSTEDLVFIEFIIELETVAQTPRTRPIPAYP